MRILLGGLCTRKNSDEIVERKARNDFDAANPHSSRAVGYQQRKLENGLGALDDNIRRSEKKLEDTTDFEEVPVRGGKVKNAFWPLSQFALFIFWITAGFTMMTATIATVITKSDKIPWAYDYPYAVAVFAFVPMGAMLAVALGYKELCSESARKFYFWSLLAAFSGLAVIWVLTFEAGYAIDTASVEDLSTESGFDIFCFAYHCPTFRRDTAWSAP